MSICYKKHGREEENHYERGTRDMSPFTPLIFSATGGMASVTVFYKRLAALLVQSGTTLIVKLCPGYVVD